MLPLELFRSRQFASANLLALVTYAALGGVIFLFVAFLQITLGYTALQPAPPAADHLAATDPLHPVGGDRQPIGPRYR